MISFIIPTLNEAPNITSILKYLDDAFYFTNLKYEVIFVDDSSSDGTVNIIESEIKKRKNVSIVNSPVRRGLGFALELGVGVALGDYLVFLDCDQSVSTDDLNNLLDHRAEGTVVVGSRYLVKSKVVGANIFKITTSKFLNYIFGRMFGINSSDISHSLRIIHKDDFISVHELYTHPGYFWIQSLKLKQSKIIFHDVPITFTDRRFGISKNRSKEMVKSVTKALLVGFRTVSKR